VDCASTARAQIEFMSSRGAARDLHAWSVIEAVNWRGVYDRTSLNRATDVDCAPPPPIIIIIIISTKSPPGNTTASPTVNEVWSPPTGDAIKHTSKSAHACASHLAGFAPESRHPPRNSL